MRVKFFNFHNVKTYRCNDRQLAPKDNYDNVEEDKVMEVNLVVNVNANWRLSYQSLTTYDMLPMTKSEAFFVRKPKS